MKFTTFGEAVAKNLQKLVADAEAGKCVLVTSSLDGEDLFSNYLDSFPEGTNPVFRERTEHDCACCRHFVRVAGGLVALYDDGLATTPWKVQIETEPAYQVVADTMDVLVMNSVSNNPFVIRVKEHLKPGSKPTRDAHIEHKMWDHFYFEFPDWLYYDGPRFSRLEAAVTTTKAMLDWNVEDVKTVLELITTGALYRGEQYETQLRNVVEFLESDRTTVVKVILAASGKDFRGVSTTKNSSIGELVQHYTDTGDLEGAVKRYEDMVAPHNYQRPKALVTPRMIAQAEEKVAELGYTDSLSRRLAVLEDIPVEHVLYTQEVARSVNPTPFEILAAEHAARSTEVSGEVKISLENFIEKVVPTAKHIEMLACSTLAPRLMTMTTAVDPDSKNILKWNNQYAWSYIGGTADVSLRERVKAAGGDITGDVRISLEWYDYDDLDLHLRTNSYGICPHIYYAVQHDRGSGIRLDVDMNVHAQTKEPVENIVIPELSRIKEGTFEVQVNNYTLRSSKQDFAVEVETGGVTRTFSFEGVLPSSATVDVAIVKVEDHKMVSVTKSDDSRIRETRSSGSVGNLEGNTWVPVQYIMNSPNSWEDGSDEAVHGIKHVFFMLEGLKAETPVRTFFNEFLDPALRENRKVFELLGGRLQLETEGQRQLSGLGFNKQQSGTVMLRVKGERSTRTYEVTI